MPISIIFSCFINNGTNFTQTAVRNITIDNRNPNVTFAATNISNNGNYSNNSFLINISVVDSGVGMANSSRNLSGFGSGQVWINITNRTSQYNFTAVNATNRSNGNNYYNITVNFANYPDGKYNITVYANESPGYELINSTGNAVYHSNNSERIQITIDTTAPSIVTLTNTSSTTTTQIVATITTSDDGSGINYCVVQGGKGTPTITGTGQAIQTLTNTELECGTSYTYTADCYDNVGNKNSSVQTSLSTKSCSVSDSGPGGGTPTTTTAVEKKFSLNILPSQEAVLSNFQDAMGVKEIKIRVNEVANNVKITVKKFDTQPSEISVPKTGQVHKYIQIITENLGTKFEGATLEFKVQKNWLSDNSIDKANVALFRFDESAGKWNELLAEYKEQDATYYYYEAQVTSFSYFAIAEKSVVLPGEPEPGEETPSVTFVKKNWVWIIVGIVVLIGIISGLLAKKLKRKKR